MCNRAVQIIPGLLQNMNESQDIVAENRGTIRRLKMMLVFNWLFFLILCFQMMLGFSLILVGLHT